MIRSLNRNNLRKMKSTKIPRWVLEEVKKECGLEGDLNKDGEKMLNEYAKIYVKNALANLERQKWCLKNEGSLEIYL